MGEKSRYFLAFEYSRDQEYCTMLLRYKFSGKNSWAYNKK